jgi:hypothetical protein
VGTNLQNKQKKAQPVKAKPLILLGAPGKIRTPDLLIRSPFLYYFNILRCFLCLDLAGI